MFLRARAVNEEGSANGLFRWWILGVRWPPAFHCIAASGVTEAQLYRDIACAGRIGSMRGSLCVALCVRLRHFARALGFGA